LVGTRRFEAESGRQPLAAFFWCIRFADAF
jgi:hypothetical protein